MAYFAERPPLKPVNGIGQPPVKPRKDHPGRITNQLIFLKKNVIEPIMESASAKMFLQPVDIVAYNIPDYYKEITEPMDLGTIRKRLENNYYQSGQECISDFLIMCNNCIKFNGRTDPITLQCNILKYMFTKKIKEMPQVEVEVAILGRHCSSSTCPLKTLPRVAELAAPSTARSTNIHRQSTDKENKEQTSARRSCAPIFKRPIKRKIKPGNDINLDEVKQVSVNKSCTVSQIVQAMSVFPPGTKRAKYQENKEEEVLNQRQIAQKKRHAMAAKCRLKTNSEIFKEMDEFLLKQVQVLNNNIQQFYHPLW